MDDQYILATCRSCENKGLLKKAAQYNQKLLDYVDEEPCAMIKINWILLESSHREYSKEKNIVRGIINVN